MRQLPAQRRRPPALSGGAAHGDAIEPLKALVSFDKVGVTVTQAERTMLCRDLGAAGDEFSCSD
jgi:hypothetical protein